jgi:hypothetical protein
MKISVLPHSEDLQKHAHTLLAIFNCVLRVRDDLRAKPIDLGETEVVFLVGYEDLNFLWHELEHLHKEFNRNLMDTRNFIKKVYIKREYQSQKDPSIPSSIVLVQDLKEYAFFLHASVNGTQQKMIDIMVTQNANQNEWEEAVRDMYKYDYNLNNLSILNGFVSSNADEMLVFLANFKFKSVNISEIINHFMDDIVKRNLKDEDYINIRGIWQVTD